MKKKIIINAINWLSHIKANKKYKSSRQFMKLDYKFHKSE